MCRLLASIQCAYNCRWSSFLSFPSTYRKLRVVPLLLELPSFCRLCTWKISSTLFNTPNIHGGFFLLSSQAFVIATTLIGFTSDLRIHIRKPPSTFRATTTERYHLNFILFRTVPNVNATKKNVTYIKRFSRYCDLHCNKFAFITGDHF